MCDDMSVFTDHKQVQRTGDAEKGVCQDLRAQANEDVNEFLEEVYGFKYASASKNWRLTDIKKLSLSNISSKVQGVH